MDKPKIKESGSAKAALARLEAASVEFKRTSQELIDSAIDLSARIAKFLPEHLIVDHQWRAENNGSGRIIAYHFSDADWGDREPLASLWRAMQFAEGIDNGIFDQWAHDLEQRTATHLRLNSVILGAGAGA